MAVVRRFLDRHPMLVAWIVLSIGMVAIFLWSSKGVPLLPMQRLALAVISVAVAGLCVWIISWE
jgi:hypothetical protein